MAPKTLSTDSPLVTPAHSPDPSSQESSLVPALDTLALVLEQIAIINAHLDAHTANVAAAAASIVADPTIAQRRHDAHCEPPRQKQPEDLPPPPPYPHAGYAPPTHGPLFPEAPLYRAPTSRGHPRPYGPPTAMPVHSPFHGGPPPPFPGRHCPPAQRGAHTNRGGRRPTIDPVVIGRVAH
jgi:hypothetical protein